jgi:hypothetical protein
MVGAKRFNKPALPLCHENRLSIIAAEGEVGRLLGVELNLPLQSPLRAQHCDGAFPCHKQIAFSIGAQAVAAATVTCKISNVAIAERSCELIFKKGKRSLKGREANEVYATLASAGVVAEGAAGSMTEGVTKLNCTLDPVVIKDNSGGGADCSFGADL